MAVRSLRERITKPGSTLNSGGVDGILASLYHTILIDLGINATKFSVLMERYLAEQRNQYPQNIRDKSNFRGNLRKALLKPHMTWKVFCGQGLRLIPDIIKFDLTIKLYFANGTTTEHSKTINMTHQDSL